jgi:DNA-directed RNA polymerase specialized sigma24 family protein
MTDPKDWTSVAECNAVKARDELKAAIDAIDQGRYRAAASLVDRAIAPIHSAAAFEYVGRVIDRRSSTIARPASGAWTDEQDAGLVRRVREGHTHREIAAALGRTPSAVSKRMSRIRSTRS